MSDCSMGNIDNHRLGRGVSPLLVPLVNRALAGVCLAVILPLGAAVAQEGAESRIEAITLSSSGLAEIRRAIAAEGAGELDFDVPLDQVNDVLKSLLVYDPAGNVASMTLDGLSPVEETFRGLPFTAEDMRALPRLLGTLQGVAVRVSSGGRTVGGMVLGVSEPAPDAETEEASPLLSVMTEEGQVATIRLRADTELDILDEAMRENLRMAASVSGQRRIEDMRTIMLTLEGTGERDVLLDYVVPAPIWKTAYRLILDAEGTVRLQAWAVIENATGDDWSDVEVTLSSGAPVTLAQALHERYWHQRPQIPVLSQSTTPMGPDRFREIAVGQAGFAAEQEIMMDTSRTAPAAAPFAMPEPSMSAAQAQAGEGETAATYRLPMPVDLPAGQTLSVPFVDAELEGERIALFQPERGEIHPISALRLENGTGTSLPAGIVTVYAPQQEGYAGDAQLANLPAGENRMLSFAADRKVEIRTERVPDEISYRASLVEGVLRVTRIWQADTVYTVSGAPDASRTVVIEHPRRDGWQFSSDALDGSTPTHHRLRVEVQEGGTAEVVATFERTETESLSLLDADSETLLFWLGQLDDPETAQQLTELADQQQEIVRTKTEISDIERELDNAFAGQERIRENLVAVPGESALAQRYLSQLEEQEDLIADMEERRGEAEQRLAQLRDAFNRAVEAL
ncbi:DUF4139 domain-containing protein [Pelagibacterium mangrovi]|uniref:DUF4139 domain-containing protein n=1 Tax=Pelagibacterium mangrovi TaxID=3119828 RepID=UPI002FC78FDA